MTIEEVVAMFLIIVEYNVRIWIVTNHFQHSTKIVTRYLKEVRQALCQLDKNFIRPRNMANEVPSYVFGNSKYIFSMV